MWIENKNYEVHVHNKKEYEIFKKYAKKLWRSPKKLLYEIQDKMWIKQNEKWHFWPKTISYLRKLYIQEKAWEALKLAKDPNLNTVVKNHNSILNKVNDGTINKAKLNVKNTKTNVSFTLWYESKTFWYSPKDMEKPEWEEYKINWKIWWTYDKWEEKGLNPARIYPPKNEGYTDWAGEKLWEMEKDLNDILFDHPEKYKWKNVLQVLEEKYWTSEEWIIKLARFVTKYMNTQYDHELSNTWIWHNWKNTISTQEMFEQYKKWEVAWVCSQIARAWAEILSSHWMMAWVVKVNSWTTHVITWWKLSNWKYILIAYWKKFVAKTPKGVLSAYQSSKWKIDMTHYVADEKWNFKGFIVTLEWKQVQLNTSSFKEIDTQSHLKNVLQNWADIQKWVKVDIKATNLNKKFEVKAWNWTVEASAWVIQNNNISPYLKKLTTFYWGIWWKVGNIYWKYWELSWKIKWSYSQAEWYNWKKDNFYNISANVDYVKNLVNTDKTIINAWLSTSWNVLIEDKSLNWQTKIASFNWNIVAWLSLKHKFNKNLIWRFYGYYGWDIIDYNLVDASWDLLSASSKSIKALRLAKKWGVMAWITYNNLNWTTFNLDWYYKKYLWWKNYWLKAWVLSNNWKTIINWFYDVLDNRWNWFWGKTTAYWVSLTYNVTDNLALMAWAVHKKYSGNNKGSNDIYVKAQYKF